MNIVYVDTSILVSILLEDSLQSARYEKMIKKAEAVVSSVLIEAEFLAVIRREKFDLEKGINYLKQISLVVPDRSLLAELNTIFSITYLRGADAFHLACALYLDPTASELKFLTADKQQQKSAQAVGFSVL